MKQYLPILFLLLFGQLLQSPLTVIHAESKDQSTESMVSDLNESSTQVQVKHIVEQVYSQNQNGNPVSMSVIEDLWGKADDIVTDTESLSHYTYQLEDEEGHLIEVKIAVSRADNTVLEALAVIETDDSNELTIDDIRDVGEILQSSYQSDTFTTLEELDNSWQAPTKISYIYDVIIYHFDGAMDHEATAMTLDNDHQVLTLNFQNHDPHLLAEPIPKNKSELDRLSHTSGVTWQEMTNQLGPPMGLNYNSEQGVITLSWHSEATDSVNDVYYHMDYDEIGMGLTYQ